MKSDIDISIIIVNYKVEKELHDCISSIINSKPKLSYEIVVVDNDNKSKLEIVLKKKFPHVEYIKSPKNIGYGGGNNLGAQYAQGEYLFFLNPDTKVLDEALNNLHNFFAENSNAGIISPVFLDVNLKPFKSQGSKELTPKNIIFSQSLLRRIFKNKNFFSNKEIDIWDMKFPRRIDAVPGAAMMIRKDLFKKIGGFDEKLFLFFEENDISKKVTNLGLKLYIIPSAKIIHLVGKSTRNLKGIVDIYSKSRFYYLRKHYGLSKAIFTHMLLSINKTSLFLLLILGLAFFLRIINIENSMRFIGDQGWFYLSARDMLINGKIPLVGIASSHPWLHQGPLWTYMLAGIFWFFGFNPVNGAYFTILLGILTVLVAYLVGSEMFSKRLGFISAFLYATSPLAVMHSRMPYHTSPIPLFLLLFIYSLYKWVKGNSMFFPLAIFFLAILYNFELATSSLWFMILSVLFYGIFAGKKWALRLINGKIIVYSALGLLVPMLPILVYDFNYGFPQTFKFALWIGYRILRFFGLPGIHGVEEAVSLKSMLIFSFDYYKYLTFPISGTACLIILTISCCVLFVSVYAFVKNKKYESGIIILALWLTISFTGYLVSKTPSEAYLFTIYPAIFFLTAHTFDKFMYVKRLYLPMLMLVIFLCFINSYIILIKEYSLKGITFSKRLSIAKEIILKTNGRKYNLFGIGAGSQFKSFTMNYEYLTWWLGHPPAKSPQKLKYVIQEKEKGIVLIENE